MSVKTYRRGVILICAALCGALTASLNIWSIFQKPLMEAYGFSPQSVSFAYTIVIAMIGLSGPIGGWLQRKAPAHIIMTVAGIGFGLGWFLTGFASTIPVLYISFGLLVGVCDGICYNLALAIATRWYPDKRGFANGVALAIMAIYPLFTAPMGNMIIENFNVSIAFNIVGVFCIVGFIVLSRFLKMPAADFKPEGWNPPAESDTKRVKNYTSGQMLKTPFFWTLLLFFGTVACTGCVMLSTVSLVGQVQAGMDAATGALMVGIFAIANGTGRLGLGAISDKLGRFQTMFVAVAVTAVIHLFLFAMQRAPRSSSWRHAFWVSASAASWPSCRRYAPMPTVPAMRARTTASCSSATRWPRSSARWFPPTRLPPRAATVLHSRSSVPSASSVSCCCRWRGCSSRR